MHQIGIPIVKTPIAFEVTLTLLIFRGSSGGWNAYVSKRHDCTNEEENGWRYYYTVVNVTKSANAELRAICI